MKYIGARYMPKFVGLYDATTAYEALSVVDNGSGTTYVANQPVPAGTPLTDTTYWATYGASSGAILNLQDQINTLGTKVSFIDPDDYTGTDEQKVQAAFDDLTTNRVIGLTRMYDINADIVISNDSNTSFGKTVIGIGADAGFNMHGYSFKSTNDTMSNSLGGIHFINIYFTGTNDCFLADTLIRMIFDNCVFDGFDHVFYDSNNKTQSYKISQCVFKNNGSIFDVHDGYDITVLNSIVESGSGTGYFYNGRATTNSLTVIGNVIEGIDKVFYCLAGSGFTFISNYFENNTEYFNMNGASRLKNVLIDNNYFYDSDPDKPIIKLASVIANPNTIQHNNGGTTLNQFIVFDDTPTGDSIYGLRVLNNDENLKIYNYSNVIPINYYVPLRTVQEDYTQVGADGKIMAPIPIPHGRSVSLYSFHDQGGNNYSTALFTVHTGDNSFVLECIESSVWSTLANTRVKVGYRIS